MNSLPPTWAQVTLSSITTDVSQRIPLTYEQITYIDIGAVDRNSKVIVAPQRISGADAPSRARKQVRSGDTLVSMTRPNLNAVALVPPELDRQIASTGFDVLRPIEGIDPRWIAYLVRTEAFVEAMSGVVQGALYPAVRSKDVRSYQVPLAPSAEQTRIADQLDKLLTRTQACNDRINAIPALLKRFQQAVLDAAASGALTEDWQIESLATWKPVQLSDVARDFSYGSAAKSSKTGSVPVLRMGNIQSGRLDWSDLVYTSDPQEIDKYKLTKGDVLFNRTNSPELVGKTAVYQGERDAIYAGYLIRVRCLPALLPEYLNYCLGSKAGRAYCWSVKSDGVSQSNINAKKLAAFRFLLPSPEEQSEIVRRVESLLSLADRIEVRYTAARAQAQRLAPLVLAKAFRGELVQQDPNDEPASVLLKRIREQAVNRLIPKNSGRASKEKPMKTSHQISLSEIVNRMGVDSFTFEQLRDEASRDYESLKDELFALLSDSDSGLRQVFDAEARSMQFKRVRK